MWLLLISRSEILRKQWHGVTIDMSRMEIEKQAFSRFPEICLQMTPLNILVGFVLWLLPGATSLATFCLWAILFSFALVIQCCISPVEIDGEIKNVWTPLFALGAVALHLILVLIIWICISWL